MTDYNNGEIWGWNGGECPVHPETEVSIWGRRGAYNTGSLAENFIWTHKHTGDFDIIAFQVTKPYVEPKVIWVNDYEDGILHAYGAKEKAMAWAKVSAISIAVKYVEAKEC